MSSTCPLPCVMLPPCAIAEIVHTIKVTPIGVEIDGVFDHSVELLHVDEGWMLPRMSHNMTICVLHRSSQLCVAQSASVHQKLMT